MASGGSSTLYYWVVVLCTTLYFVTITLHCLAYAMLHWLVSKYFQPFMALDTLVGLDTDDVFSSNFVMNGSSLFFVRKFFANLLDLSRMPSKFTNS